MKYLIWFLIPINCLATTTIAIIDTGLDLKLFPNAKLCKGGHLNAVSGKKEIVNAAAHGTFVYKALSENLKNSDYCVYIINVYKNGVDTQALINGLKHIKKLKPDIINYSISGPLPIPKEMILLDQISNNGTKIFVASGNNKKDLSVECSSYPACYYLPKVSVIGCRDMFCNVKGPINKYETGTVSINGKIDKGSSFATPRAIAAYIRRLK